jgi:hypothetical protein
MTGHQIREAHSYLTQFVEEFEHLYYQSRVDRLHFCRPSLHTLLHTAAESSRTGPGTTSLSSEWKEQLATLAGTSDSHLTCSGTSVRLYYEGHNSMH